MKKETTMTPKRIVEELDKYIVSQNEAKKSVAISLKNRDRRKKIKDVALRKEITPQNVILIGPTGVGKTEIARRIAKIINAPFIKVEATKYTEVGYVGKDVESIIKDLVELTFRKMRDDMYENLRKKSYENALEQTAKILDPKGNVKSIVRDIKAGKYNDQEIEIDRKNRQLNMPMIEIVGGSIDENTSIGNIFEQMIGNPSDGMIHGNEKVKVKVKEAIKRFTDDDVEKRMDMEDLREKVVDNVENNGIVFIDEIDKIAERGGLDRGEVSRQGVQRDILPIVEGSTVITSAGPIRTDHILFVAAGAFTQSSPGDMMPELQGRFPIRVKLKSLDKDDFIKILTKVEYNLLDQYKAMLATDGVELKFTKKAIELISKLAADMNENIENIGARRLGAIVEDILKDILYEAPYETPKKITIDVDQIKKIFAKEISSENLDKFIL